MGSEGVLGDDGHDQYRPQRAVWRVRRRADEGRQTLGSLTLLRWYAAHVFLLPAALIAFVVAHLYLMRRHGISGALKPVTGASKPFYPVSRAQGHDCGAVVFALLLTFAIMFSPPLDPSPTRPTPTYVPRPEWYFLSLFQLLKYFPGPLEPLATMVIPGLVVALLFLLPFLDRARRPPSAQAAAGDRRVRLIGLGIIVLTYLGYKDTPAHADPAGGRRWPSPAGEFATDQRCITLPSSPAARPTRSLETAYPPRSGMAAVARARPE